MSEQSSIPQDLKEEGRETQVAGRDMPVKRIETPAVTGKFAQESFRKVCFASGTTPFGCGNGIAPRGRCPRPSEPGFRI